MRHLTQVVPQLLSTYAEVLFAQFKINAVLFFH